MSAKKNPTDAAAAADPTVITDPSVAVTTPVAAQTLPNGGGSYALIDGVLVLDAPDATDTDVKEA